jgi:6-phosphogluconolactonase
LTTYFFTGSYSQHESPAPKPDGIGISCFQWNNETAEIKLMSTTFQRNVGYLIISEDSAMLYAAEELPAADHPMLMAYKIESTGELKLINSQKLLGEYSCHLCLVNNMLVTANYISGELVFYDVHEDGTLGAAVQVICHSGSGPNTKRQESAHPHMIYAMSPHLIFCVDLGLDIAKAYRYNALLKKWAPFPDYDLQVCAGAGARHMVMDASRQFAIVLGELSGQLFLFSLGGDRFELADTVQLAGEKGQTDFSAAAIKMHPQKDLVIVTERNSNNIVICEIKPVQKKLHMIGRYSSEGSTPRDFAIDPSGNFLIVSNQDSNQLCVFSINNRQNTIQYLNLVEVFTPSCISFAVS